MPKDRARIIARGGGELEIRELVTNGTFYNLGYLSEVTLNVDADLAQVRDGVGALLDEKLTTQTVILSATLLQTSIEEIDKIINAREKYFDVLYSVKVNDTTYQEIYIPLAKIRPKGTIPYKAEVRNLPIEIIALLGKHTSNETVTATGGNFIIPPGAYFVIREGTSSFRPVTESPDSVKNKFY